MPCPCTRLAGVVLAGGDSRRMKRAKALLAFGDESMLERVVRRVGGATRPVVVAAAPGQGLPPLPAGTEVVVDRWPGRGPLAAIVTALGCLGARVEAAFVTGCDTPLLCPAFVAALDACRPSESIALPVHADGRPEPLAAVYPLSALPVAERLVESGERSLLPLFEVVPTCRVPVAALRDADPTLASLVNVNTPEDYRLALDLATD